MLSRFFTLGAAACVPWINTMAHAQSLPGPTQLPSNQQQPSGPAAMPYKEVLPLKADSRIIRAFIMFDCPYSFLYDTVLWRWGRDLPKDWQIQFSPVFTSQPSSFAPLKAFYAAQAADPLRLELFMNKAYSALQMEKRNPMDQQTWVDVVSAAGIPMDRFVASWTALDDSESLVAPSVKWADHYGIEVTPTIAIDGRYTITPDSTNGDPELFIQLLNGMVSKAAGYA